MPELATREHLRLIPSRASGAHRSRDHRCRKFLPWLRLADLTPAALRAGSTAAQALAFSTRSAAAMVSTTARHNGVFPPDFSARRQRIGRRFARNVSLVVSGE